MTTQAQIFRFFGKEARTYEEIWDFQRQRIQEIAEGKAPESVIFCEHESVITAGRRYRKENLKSSRIPVHFIERGGDFTWHGPGQLVIYPLLRLNGSLFPGGLAEYLRFCEEWVIQVLARYGLEAGRFGPTGVWVDSESPRKIASVGVAVRRWFTYHGIALNVSNDWEGFQQIRPCNFEASVMTSMQNEGAETDMNQLQAAFENQFLEFQLSQFGRGDIGRQEAS